MKRALMAVVTAGLLLSACSGQNEASTVALDRAAEAAPAAPPLPAPPMPHAKRVAREATADVAGVAPERHIAVRHELQLQTDAQAVESAWRRANDACVAAGCEVLVSSVSRDDERRPAQAQLEARVPPDKLQAFLQQVSTLGSVGQHSKTAEDKTDEVIDTEARLKNMVEFRDRLRHLMTTPGARLRELIEVERELVRVQSEIDSLASRRKVLSAHTEKVLVSINITARPSVLEDGVWSPVSEAVTGAGRVLARSVGGVISFVVATLPWAVLLGAAVFAVRVGWRLRRRADGH